MKIETIIFDWSGCISNDLPPVFKTCMKIFDIYNLKAINLQDYRKAAANPHSLFWSKFLPDEPMENIQNHFNEIFQSEATGAPEILKGAKDTIEFLNQKNIKLFVLSSHPTHFLETEAVKYGISQYFVELYGSKPDKEIIISEIIKKYNLNKDTTLFVEDMVEGIAAGKKNQIKTVALLSGYHDREKLSSQQPDYIFDDITGLKTLFN